MKSCRHYVSLPNILAKLEPDWEHQIQQYPERKDFIEGMIKAFHISKWAVLNEFKREFIQMQIEHTAHERV